MKFRGQNSGWKFQGGNSATQHEVSPIPRPESGEPHSGGRNLASEIPGRKLGDRNRKRNLSGVGVWQAKVAGPETSQRNSRGQNWAGEGQARNAAGTIPAPESNPLNPGDRNLVSKRWAAVVQEDRNSRGTLSQAAGHRPDWGDEAFGLAVADVTEPR
jgi:hypothetical protein